MMHNKFIVVDGRYVWTGSLNTTDNGAYKNNNNAIWIDSPEPRPKKDFMVTSVLSVGWRCPLHATVAFGSVITGEPGVTRSVVGSKCDEIAIMPVPSRRTLKRPPAIIDVTFFIILMSHWMPSSNAKRSLPLTNSASFCRLRMVIFLPSPEVCCHRDGLVS